MISIPITASRDMITPVKRAFGGADILVCHGRVSGVIFDSRTRPSFDRPITQTPTPPTDPPPRPVPRAPRSPPATGSPPPPDTSHCPNWPHTASKAQSKFPPPPSRSIAQPEVYPL